MDQPLTPYQAELAAVLHSADIVFYVALIFYGMAMWEFVSRVPAEVMRIYLPEFNKWASGKFDHASLPVVFVLANRLALPMIIAFSLSQLQQPATGTCRALYNGCLTLLAITTFTCKAIEVLRVTGIRKSSAAVRAVLWVATVLLFALWLVYANTQHSLEHAPYLSFPYASTCGPIVKNGRWHISVWASDLLLELVLLVLVIDHAVGGFFAEAGPFGKHSLSMEQRVSLFSRVTRQYYVGALLWFVFCFAVNLLQLIWFAVHTIDLFGGLMIPIQIWLTTTMGPRLVVDMRLTQGHFANFSILGGGSQGSKTSFNGSDRIASFPPTPRSAQSGFTAHSGQFKRPSSAGTTGTSPTITTTRTNESIEMLDNDLESGITKFASHSRKGSFA